MTDHLRTITREGYGIRLEPMNEGHAHLCVGQIDPALFRYFTIGGPKEDSILGWSNFLRAIYAADAVAAYAIIDPTTEQILGHQLRVFAVTTQQRINALPNVPTSAEGGLPAFEVSVWHGMYAPKGTSAEIVNRLSTALQVALRDPRLVARFRELGTEPVAQDRATPAAHRAFWTADIAKWRPIIQAAGQYAD